MFKACVMTVTDCSRRAFKWRAISAVVVPESRMIGFVVLDEFGRGSSDSSLFRVVQCFLQAQRIVLTGLHLPHRAAMRTDHHSLRRQGIQIGTSGYGRDRKSLHQITDRDLASLFNEVQNLSAPLFRQQTRVLGSPHGIGPRVSTKW